jgi:general secretion pathway protein G
MKKRGFTLIELIVVIAIIAILAAIIAPNAFRAIEKAKVSATIGDYKSIKTGAMAYYVDTGVWPANGATTRGLVLNDTAIGWDGPYLEKWPPMAKWGGNYSFQNNAAVDWSGDAAPDTARYIAVTLVPLVSAQRIDQGVDGIVGNAAGSARYVVSNPTTVNILISTEVRIN